MYIYLGSFFVCHIGVDARSNFSQLLKPDGSLCFEHEGFDKRILHSPSQPEVGVTGLGL